MKKHVMLLLFCLCFWTLGSGLAVAAPGDDVSVFDPGIFDRPGDIQRVRFAKTMVLPTTALGNNPDSSPGDLNCRYYGHEDNEDEDLISMLSLRVEWGAFAYQDTTASCTLDVPISFPADTEISKINIYYNNDSEICELSASFYGDAIDSFAKSIISSDSVAGVSRGKLTLDGTTLKEDKYYHLGMELFCGDDASQEEAPQVYSAEIIYYE